MRVVIVNKKDFWVLSSGSDYTTWESDFTNSIQTTVKSEGLMLKYVCREANVTTIVQRNTSMKPHTEKSKQYTAKTYSDTLYAFQWLE